MDQKIVGYILLIIGVSIVLFSGISVFQVFNNKTQPYQLFSLDSISLDLKNMLPTEQANLLTNSNFEILSGDISTKMTNIFMHLVLMGFIGSVGFKIAMIGSNMIKVIEFKTHLSKKDKLDLEEKIVNTK